MLTVKIETGYGLVKRTCKKQDKELVISRLNNKGLKFSIVDGFNEVYKNY